MNKENTHLYRMCPGCGRKHYNVSFGEYCTYICKSKSEENTVDCATCSIKFFPKTKKHKYCSDACMRGGYQAAYSEKGKRRLSIRLPNNRHVVIIYPKDFCAHDRSVFIEGIMEKKQKMVT